MALIKCGECGSKISEQATACPKCGAPPSAANKKPRRYGFGTLLMILLAIGFVSSAISNCSAERERAAQVEKQRVQHQAAAEVQQKKLDEFRNNPAPTLALARELAGKQKWSEVVQLLKPLLAAGNSDAQRLYLEASERQLIALAANLPASNLEANYENYKQLATLRPDNQAYVRKRDSYKAKWDEQQAKELAEKLVFGDPPRASSWDGSYHEVQVYLKRVANDPDSIEMAGCTDVYKNKDGWLVGCQYRGKNAFGGTILTANWFRIQRGQVVEVYDHDKFEWPRG